MTDEIIRLKELAGNFKVLYVEDEDAIRQTVANGPLAKMFKEFHVAENGLVGLEKFKETLPDIVMSDINMPKMNGIEMIAEIKKLDQDVQIIITTAYSDQDYFLKAIEVGVDFYLIKPINIRLLIQTFTKASVAIKNRIEAARFAKIEIEQQINLAKARAEAASEAKSAFLASMSHEIRTPLNGLMGFIGFLSNSKNLNQKEKEYVTLIDRSAKNLLSIINDILDISKIEAGKMELSFHDFNPVYEFSSVAELFLATAKTKNITLETFIAPNMPTTLNSDELKIKQVLSNLISNALKFTPESGTINFRVDILNQTDSLIKLHFSVKDSGIGMSAETANSLFKPFTQADSSISRSYGGTGLGLSIAQRMVNMLGGEIVVKSEIGHGSEFCFDLELNIINSEIALANKQLSVAIVTGEDFTKDHALLLDYLQALNISVEFVEFQNLDLTNYTFCFIHYLDKDNLQTEDIGNVVLFSTTYIDDVIFKNSKSITLIASGIVSIFTDTKTLDENSAYKLKRFVGNVLVVDDNDVNQILMSEILLTYGMVCDIASDGYEAYEKVKSKHYDLILMDLHMPKCDGIQSLKLIREYEQQNGLNEHKVVVLTADAISGKREELLLQGFNAYLTKPVVQDQLYSVMLGCLQAVDVVVCDVERKHCENIAIDGFFNANQTANELNISLQAVVKSFKSFVKSANDSVLKIEEALKNQDRVEIGNIAHKVCGASGNLRISKIAEIAKWIEDNAKSAEFVEINKQSLSLIKNIQTIHSKIAI